MVRTTSRKKIVIVGDGACGKTSLLIVYQNGKFPEVCLLMRRDDVKLTITQTNRSICQQYLRTISLE